MPFASPAGEAWSRQQSIKSMTLSTGRVVRIQPLVGHSSLVQRSPQECLGSVWEVNPLLCYKGMSFSSIRPLKPSGMKPKRPNALTRAAYHYYYLLCTSGLQSSWGHLYVLPFTHLFRSVLRRLKQSRPFIFATCSIQCTLTSPWGSMGWISWAHSPSYLGPFSLTQYLPSSKLFAWGSSVTPADPSRSVQPVLQNLGTVKAFKLALHLDNLRRQRTYKAGKSKADASPSSSSVTTSCANVGSCFTFLCPSSPSLKRMTTLLTGLQSWLIALTMKSAELSARSEGNCVATPSPTPKSLLPTRWQIALKHHPWQNCFSFLAFIQHRKTQPFLAQKHL